MGAWGTAISSNDTFADVYDDFFQLYNDGIEVEEISNRLILQNQETINNPDDSNNFWFALAKSQWECKQLDIKVLERVRQIIESGQDLEVWRQLDADEKDLKRRKIILKKFLADLQTDRPKAKSRKKKIIRQPVFEKGDCLAFRLANGNFGGAVVLEAIRDTQYGHNLIALTRINQPSKPTKKDFENAEILIINYENWDNKPIVLWFHPIRYRGIAHLIEKVDKVEVQLSYDIYKTKLGFIADFDLWFIAVANTQFQSELSKPRSSDKQKMKDWIKKKDKWKFW